MFVFASVTNVVRSYHRMGNYCGRYISQIYGYLNLFIGTFLWNRVIVKVFICPWCALVGIPSGICTASVLHYRNLWARVLCLWICGYHVYYRVWGTDPLLVLVGT